MKIYSAASFASELRTMRPGGLALTERAIEHSSFKPGAKIADIGCGTGATVAYLQKHSFDVVGLDISITKLNEGLTKDPGMALLQGDSTTLPFVSGALDGIISECSLSVMNHKQKVLREFHRVLKPGGTLIISDVVAENPAAINAGRSQFLPFCISGLMNIEDLQDFVARQGFRIRVWEDHSHLLRSFLGRYIMENPCDAGFCAELGALKQARPGYLLIIAIKGDA